MSRDLAVIIVSWNVRQLLERCLTSVYESLARSAEAPDGRRLECRVWVVDNNSSDGSLEMVRTSFPQARLIANRENKGFAGGSNQALQQVQEQSWRYVMLLNPDTVVCGRALETLVRFLEQKPSAGMAGARLVYGDGGFQHSGFGFPGLAQILVDLFPVPARLHDTRLNGRYPRAWYDPDAPPFPIDHPLGATMLVRREVVDSVGPLDTRYFVYCEEIDWAMRIRAAGWEIYCVPAAKVVHYGGQSTSQVQAQSFVDKWRSRHRLYHRHYRPAKVRAAGWLVRLGMRLKGRQAATEELRRSYREVAEIWSKS